MRIRTTCCSQLLILVVLWCSNSVAAQKTGSKASPSRRPIQTATAVKTELVAGSLNPSRTVIGDEISLKLNEDVKSNGKTVFKKGTIIKGVVRNVRQAETAAPVRSLIDIEWTAPEPLIDDASALMVTLQSIAYLSPMGPMGPTGPAVSKPPTTAMSREAAPAAGGAGFVHPPESVATPAAVRPNGRTNTALMSMPSIVLVDQRTTAALETGFGLTGEEQIYKTGRGDMITAAGALQSVDLYSFLSNDTMIVSADKDFEVGTGARMQLLVGIERK